MTTLFFSNLGIRINKNDKTDRNGSDGGPKKTLGCKILIRGLQFLIKNQRKEKRKLNIHRFFGRKYVHFEAFLEHIFKEMGSTEIVMSSVRLSLCLSVAYFSAGIAPRELKF
jgi:hypothetical protein